MRFLFFAFLILTISVIGCLHNPDTPPAPDAPKVSVDGYVVISLIQKGNTPEYYLKADTVNTPDEGIDLPDEPLRLRAKVVAGQIIKIESNE